MSQKRTKLGRAGGMHFPKQCIQRRLQLDRLLSEQAASKLGINAKVVASNGARRGRDGKYRIGGAA